MNFSLTENVKIINAIPPASNATGFAGDSKILNMGGYDRLVFLIMTGATSTSDSVITINAMNASTISGSTDVAIPFKYKYCDGTTDKISENFIDATNSGFAMTASKANSYYAIEINAADLQFNAGDNYKYARLTATANTSNAQIVSVMALLYNGRYAQAQLKTASYST